MQAARHGAGTVVSVAVFQRASVQQARAAAAGL